jgi:hypothetical protein
MGIMPSSFEKNPTMYSVFSFFGAQSRRHRCHVFKYVFMVEPCPRAPHPRSFQNFLGGVYAREGKPPRRTVEEGHHHVQVQGLDTWVKISKQFGVPLTLYYF